MRSVFSSNNWTKEFVLKYPGAFPLRRPFLTFLSISAVSRPGFRAKFLKIQSALSQIWNCAVHGLRRSTFLTTLFSRPSSGRIVWRTKRTESHNPPLIIFQTGFHNAGLNLVNWSWLLTRVVAKRACVRQPNPQGSISSCCITTKARENDLSCTKETEQNINWEKKSN